MSYIPTYEAGRLIGIKFGVKSLALSEQNSDYQAFLKWLQTQGKSLETWLAENPPPVVDLNALKLQKGQLLKKQLEDRLAAHYSPLDLLSLSNLMNEAVATGKTNRAKYLEPLNVWALGVYQLFYTAQAQLEAAKTQAEVESVTIDYMAWEGACPKITFSAVMGIVD